MIHHDLKSKNVMVVAPQQPGGPWGAKLIDFGESRGTGVTSTHGGNDETASAGTRGYTAPEQDVNWTRTARRCDELSEAYSFAVIVWEMATRRRPAAMVDVAPRAPPEEVLDPRVSLKAANRRPVSHGRMGRTMGVAQWAAVHISPFRPTDINRLGLNAKEDHLPYPDKISTTTRCLITAAGTTHPDERREELGERAAAFSNIVHFFTAAEPRAPLRQSWRTCLIQELGSLPPNVMGKVAAALGIAALGQRPEDLPQLLCEQPSGGLECAVRIHAVLRLERFFAGLGKAATECTTWLTKARAAAFPMDLPEQPLETLLDQLGSVWQQVTDAYLVRRTEGPADLRFKRQGCTLLVVRCGFFPCSSGFMPSNGVWEGFTVKTVGIGPRDDPNTAPLSPRRNAMFDFGAAVDTVAQEIKTLVADKKRVLVMAGSRGGLFFAGENGLWDRMRLPEGDEKHIPRVACLMLNVHPSVKAARLPEGVSIVFTYGSHEGRHPLIQNDNLTIIGGGGKRDAWLASFMRERGAPSVVDPPPESLESLVNASQGSRLQRFVYYKGDNSSSPSREDRDFWSKLRQDRREVAKWPRPPKHLFPKWPPKDITKHEAWPQLMKPTEPPPFLGAAYVMNLFSKLGTDEQQLSLGPSGDGHDPASIYHDHCLLRLIDAALEPQPEPTFIASYPQLLTNDRRQAEETLGLLPESLVCATAEHLNAFTDAPNRALPLLAAVPEGSDEWRSVAAVFYARHRSEYHADEFKYPWSPDNVKLTMIERVQNLAQLSAFRTRKDAIVAGLEEAGVKLPSASCMRWGFHGATHDAIESIVRDPISGFQGVMVDRTVWGRGLYFARDAIYSYYATGMNRVPMVRPKSHMARPMVFGSRRWSPQWPLAQVARAFAEASFLHTGTMQPPGFCELKDGVVKILLCQLVTGLTCAADQDMKLLPMFKKPMRYHSSVDSLSNPQVPAPDPEPPHP